MVFAGILFISKECGTVCKLGFSLPVDSDVICCCTVDLLEAGSLHAALTRYLIFLQLLPLMMMMHTFGLSCTISHFSLRCRQWLWHVVCICLIYPARRCSKWGGSIFDLTMREHPAHFILQERSALQAWLQYADVLHCLDCRVGGAGYLEIMNPCGWLFLSLTGNGLNFSLIYIRAVRILWFGIAGITEYPSYCRII